MSIKETIKSKTLSIAAFAVMTITTALLINALMITTNAQENNPKKKPSGDSSQRKTTGGQVNTEGSSSGSRKTRNPMSNSEYNKTEAPANGTSTERALPEDQRVEFDRKAGTSKVAGGERTTGSTSKVAGGERNATNGTSSGLGGAYIATTTGVSGAVATGAGSGMGRGGRGGQSGGQGAGTNLQIQINKFISDSQVDQLETASANGNLTQALSNMNCGTVVIGGKSITINAAIAAKGSNNGVIYLLSEQTFSTQGENGSAVAGAVGFIEMRLSGNSGKGSMYTTTQVAVTNGSVALRGGASTATQLTIQKSGSETGTSSIPQPTTPPIPTNSANQRSTTQTANADVTGDSAAKPQSGSRNSQRSGNTSAKKKP